LTQPERNVSGTLRAVAPAGVTARLQLTRGSGHIETIKDQTVDHQRERVPRSRFFPTLR